MPFKVDDFPCLKKDNGLSNSTRTRVEILINAYHSQTLFLSVSGTRWANLAKVTFAFEEHTVPLILASN